MPKYKYTVLDNSGKKIQGTQEAASADRLAVFLQEQNYTVMKIDEVVDVIEEVLSGGIPKVKLKQRVVFTNQLSTMIGAGLPITESLEILVSQSKDKALQKNLQSVLEAIEKEGMQISDALQKYTRIYSEVQISLIRAGESSGNLHEVLLKVAEDLKKANRLQSKIKGAMIYPVIIFVLVAVVLYVLVTKMIPAVEALYQDFGVTELPAITAFLVHLSNFLANPLGSIFLLILIVSIIAGYKFYRSTETGRFMTDKLFLKIPVFGNLIGMLQVAQFSRLISMLLRSGIPITEALRVTSNALDNVLFRDVLIDAKANVEAGIPLAAALARSEVYPPLLVKMVETGERTGKLDSILTDMADFYEAEVEEISDNLNKLMEPMILIVVGGLVAFLAVGIYLPIYSIGQYIS